MQSKFTFDIDDVVQKYADMVYRLAKIHSRNEYEVEDAFQEVFLKLFQNQESIISEEHLKAWLIRVTINQCHSMSKTAWNRHKVAMESIQEQGEEPVTEEKEDFSEVYEAVRELPDKYKEAIHLYYYEEYSIKEIASLLGKSESTIKTQLSRGRQLLEKKLKEVYTDEGI